ncbi:hypothetical protein L837_0271 [Mycobacterium avium MAV_061107_1842]|uniref:Uncharacterized protein n=1 Tax=Mycobacterium avium (strain 104) TaxID=243243 RepID=A0A0H2ZS51_MYCA1|nr:hypothetical protein MAV_4779 [Mycobacterium avium 104]ETZ48238.1 hypothetical protein L839_2347 [Mycobacterium avium MAV_120809_2495]ETZ49515.1 hypothetical protein L837_0271 [Mycobacterium avium MAV_061107_1842]ETZ76498.1 hypothetical protein L840_0418 [Mycobacterium sp. MAC_011194_8550]
MGPAPDAVGAIDKMAVGRGMVVLRSAKPLVAGFRATSALWQE